MILLADSGATKTDWLLYSENVKQNIRTIGINPFHQSTVEIREVVDQQLLPSLPSGCSIQSIYFYGSGCNKEKKQYVEEPLASVFPNANINVDSDLLGAARALLGRQVGIACILGTGSNSCLYDGEDIIKNVASLGYILGDEGSGAVLGKRLAADCLKHLLPEHLCTKFYQRFNLTPALILEKVYRQPQANRFLASLAPFIGENKQEPAIHQLLIGCFSDFFERSISQYGRDLSVNFVGSVAFYCQEELAEVADKFHYSIGKIIQNPIDELASYHA